jgi:hypothetical protein
MDAYHTPCSRWTSFGYLLKWSCEPCLRLTRKIYPVSRGTAAPTKTKCRLHIRPFHPKAVFECACCCRIIVWLYLLVGKCLTKS